MTKKQLENATKTFNNTISESYKIPAFKGRVELNGASIKIGKIENTDPKKIVEGKTVKTVKDGKIISRKIIFDSSIYNQINIGLEKFNAGEVLEIENIVGIVKILHEAGHTREIYPNGLKKGTDKDLFSEGLNEKIARINAIDIIKDRYKRLEEKDGIKDMLNNLENMVSQNKVYDREVKIIEKALGKFDIKISNKIYNDMRDKLKNTDHEKIFETFRTTMRKYDTNESLIKSSSVFIEVRENFIKLQEEYQIYS